MMSSGSNDHCSMNQLFDPPKSVAPNLFHGGVVGRTNPPQAVQTNTDQTLKVVGGVDLPVFNQPSGLVNRGHGHGSDLTGMCG